MVSTVSIRFSLRGIIVSLFAVAVLSQCGNDGALCKRNSVDCPQGTINILFLYSYIITLLTNIPLWFGKCYEVVAIILNFVDLSIK